MTPDDDLAGRLRQVVDTDEDAAHAVEVVRAAGWGPGADERERMAQHLELTAAASSSHHNAAIWRAAAQTTRSMS